MGGDTWVAGSFKDVTRTLSSYKGDKKQRDHVDGGAKEAKAKSAAGERRKITSGCVSCGSKVRFWGTGASSRITLADIAARI